MKLLNEKHFLFREEENCHIFFFFFYERKKKSLLCVAKFAVRTTVRGCQYILC